jgi:hypothetical protein
VTPNNATPSSGSANSPNSKPLSLEEQRRASLMGGVTIDLGDGVRPAAAMLAAAPDAQPRRRTPSRKPSTTSG